MKDWGIWTNSHPDWMKGSISVSEMPFWLWFIGELVERCMFPRLLSYIPLPNWPKISRWKHCEPGESFTPREWYGDLSGLWHAWVSDPIFQWYWRRAQKYETHVEIGYAKVRELFEAKYPERFQHDDEMDAYRKEKTDS
jgi:hypothetical protein